MEPWSQGEFLVASLFLAPIDITLKRFERTTRICGNNPRRCFDAAVSLDALTVATNEVLNAIKQCKEFLHDTIAKVYAGEAIHCAFDIFPSPKIKCWECGLIQPISDWALSQIIAELDRRAADAAYRLYNSMKGITNYAAFGRRMFEKKVHKFFWSITEPRGFTIRSLENSSTTVIEFSSTTNRVTFKANQHFSGQLASSINGRRSCYLKPLSLIFPAFDSFLYQHEKSQRGRRLIGFQITTARDHPISVIGLDAVQECLTPNIPKFKALRPTIDAK